MTAARQVIFGCAGPRLLTQERRFFGRVQPWGFILFARNVVAPDQLRALVAELRDSVGRAAPVLIDQEGGRVQRMGLPHWRAWVAPLDQGEQARDPVRAMYLRGRLIAAELGAAGIDVNCAPLADIARQDTHPFLRNRCYGTCAASVSARARAMARGLLDGGVLPVLKHLPGHGRARLDSHHVLPVVDAAPETLAREDFAAFHALADLPLGMTGHLLFPAIDPDAPVTTSARMIRLIRAQIGFEGLLMTDDIAMQALSGTVAARAEAALAAGCDLVLHCNAEPDEMAALADVCPVLTGDVLRRAHAACAGRTRPDDADLAALEAAYAALMTPAA